MYSEIVPATPPLPDRPVVIMLVHSFLLQAESGQVFAVNVFLISTFTKVYCTGFCGSWVMRVMHQYECPRQL